MGNGRAGLDLNLKYGAYSNINVVNCVFDGCGTGEPNSTGLAIKARSAGSYAANPATLTAMTVSGTKFLNCGGPGFGAAIRLGETSSTLTGLEVGPSGVSITKCSFSGNQAHNLRDGRAGGSVIINAKDNWWGAVGPTLVYGNLDTSTGQAIIELLFAMNAEAGTTLVLVTHDDHLAARCHRTLRLDSGRLVADERR